MPVGIEAYPYLTLLVPVLVLAGSWITSRLLGFSWWLCALLACFPLIIPELNLPITSSLQTVHPLMLIAGGWGVLFVIAMTRALVRPARAAIGTPGGVISAVYLMLLLAALTVVTLLYVEPTILERTLPGWRGGLGLVLLAVAALTMAISLIRVMKLVTVFAVWGVVSLVLASEIFLHKLPTEILKEEVTRLSPLIARDRFEALLSGGEYAFKSDASPKIAIVRSATQVLAVRPEETYPARLGFWLRKVSAWPAADVVSAGGDDLSVVQLAELLRGKVLPMRPDAVVISSLMTDATEGINAFGDKGISEGTAERIRQLAQATEASLFTRFWNDSRLMRFLRFTAGGEKELSRNIPREPRVLPADYRQAIRSMVARVKASRSQPVLLLEPIDECPRNIDCSTYEEMVRAVADETDTPLIDGSALVRETAVGYPFVRGNILSREGHEQLAKGLTRSLTKLLKEKNGQTVRPVIFDDPKIDAADGLPAQILVRPADLNGDIVFHVQPIQQGPLYYRIVFSVNDSFVADRRLDTREQVRARFQIPDGFKKLPVAKLSLQMVASPPGREDEVGNTGVFVQVPIELAAFKGRPASIETTTGELVADFGKQFVAAGIDPNSGMVIAELQTRAGPDTLDEIERWSSKLPWGTILALAGTFGNDFTPSSSRFAALDLAPKKGSSIAALGIVGLRSASGMVKQSSEGVTLRRGSKIVHQMAHFKLDAVENNSVDLLALDRAWKVGA